MGRPGQAGPAGADGKPVSTPSFYIQTSPHSTLIRIQHFGENQCINNGCTAIWDIVEWVFKSVRCQLELLNIKIIQL